MGKKLEGIFGREYNLIKSRKLFLYLRGSREKRNMG